MAKTLDDIPVGVVWQAQQAALMRLQLFAIGQTHGMLRAVLAGCRDAIGKAGLGGTSEMWDGLSLHQAIREIDQVWKREFGQWTAMLEGLRWEAACIPIGTLAVLHREAFAGALEHEGAKGREAHEARRRGGRGGVPPDLQEAEAGPGVVFEPQLRGMLDATRNRLWGDGFDISSRIWRLDQDSLNGIRRVVYDGVASGKSAWDMAKELEQFLGPRAGCPRWTRSRLYGLTKAEIAGGDRTGLYSGEECASQGVAYNALRLARNEIQIAHHALSDELMRRAPWIEKERIFLSPAHPETDECDDVIADGENGQGIYPVGTIVLPIHPQCLCGKVGVQAPPDEFARKLRGWLREGEPWQAMDDYAGMLGTGRSGIGSINLAVGLAERLALWLWGGSGDLLDAIASWVTGSGQLRWLGW